MSVYFVKNESKIYRFGGWRDLENLTGKSRALFKQSLARSLRESFPSAELAGRFGASLRGWIDDCGEPAHSFSKGNTWTSRKAYGLEKLSESKNKVSKEIRLTSQHLSPGITL